MLYVSTAALRQVFQAPAHGIEGIANGDVDVLVRVVAAIRSCSYPGCLRRSCMPARLFAVARGASFARERAFCAHAPLSAAQMQRLCRWHERCSVERRARAMKELTSHAWTSMEHAISSLERLASEAPSSRELATYWRDFERRLLAELREDESTLLPLLSHPPDAERMLAEHERIRNLAWEVGITADLGCIHVRAIRKLGLLLRERAARARTAKPSRAVGLAPTSN